MDINTPALTIKDASYFPNPEESDAQGLVYIGGELDSKRLLTAYARGIFPWYNPENPPLWWSPNPRLLIYPDKLSVSKSLKKSLKKTYRISFDTHFHEVILACAEENNRENHTWIHPEMIDAYQNLHDMGYAHSVEVWDDKKLIGGLYGISLGHAFFGESMFHRETDASKIALYYLCEFAKKHQIAFIDAQLTSAHLLSLGGVQVHRKAFLHALNEALNHETLLGKWQAFI